MKVLKLFIQHQGKHIMNFFFFIFPQKWTKIIQNTINFIFNVGNQISKFGKIIKSSSNKLAKEVDNSISTFNFKLVNMVKCNASNNNP
jgi:hypothetical protein